MSRVSTLSDLLTSILDRGARLVDFSATPGQAVLEGLCHELMSSKGEASSVVLANEILSRYAALKDDGALDFFRFMASGFDPSADAVSAAADAWAADPSPEALANLFNAVEPPRQELLRRLNTAPGSTQRLVAMRADLLPLLRTEPDLKRIDHDFRHLLRSWFNRGFLVMKPVDWDSPAALLEKIIAYEAVHQIDSWDELRRRLQPRDRRCFAFFHPSMPDEPLIFVEVALAQQIPGSIRAVLAEERSMVDPAAATTAVFYSISNCQKGLAGVSFGAFLIKQVARDLSAELPRLETFVTLSPVPGFVAWLARQPDMEPLSTALDGPGWTGDETLRPQVLAAAAQYFLGAKRDDGQPPDPVARFHLGNGAELDAIHWMGDPSAKGLEQGAGLMVNYRYRLDKIEANHEAYIRDGTIAASRSVKAFL
ncbi:MAG: malonyl-CoA decarboxylase [Pseudomonadota bacterium]